MFLEPQQQETSVPAAARRETCQRSTAHGKSLAPQGSLRYYFIILNRPQGACTAWLYRTARGFRAVSRTSGELVARDRKKGVNKRDELLGREVGSNRGRFFPSRIQARRWTPRPEARPDHAFLVLRRRRRRRTQERGGRRCPPGDPPPLHPHQGGCGRGRPFTLHRLQMAPSAILFSFSFLRFPGCSQPSPRLRFSPSGHLRP